MPDIDVRPRPWKARGGLLTADEKTILRIEFLGAVANMFLGATITLFIVAVWVPYWWAPAMVTAQISFWTRMSAGRSQRNLDRQAAAGGTADHG